MFRPEENAQRPHSNLNWTEAHPGVSQQGEQPPTGTFILSTDAKNILKAAILLSESLVAKPQPLASPWVVAVKDTEAPFNLSNMLSSKERTEGALNVTCCSSGSSLQYVHGAC